MAEQFSTLERNILRTKGATEEDLAALTEAGVVNRSDFQTVGDLETLLALAPGMERGAAERVLAWAVGQPAGTELMRSAAGQAAATAVVVESADVVYCTHCHAKQPKDYKSGDLCVACGQQVEPILTCYWCSAAGPGRFCRACGAEFVAPGELDLAILLRREGLAKDEVPRRLRSMSAAEKELLWGRVRRARS